MRVNTTRPRMRDSLCRFPSLSGALLSSAPWVFSAEAMCLALLHTLIPSVWAVQGMMYNVLYPLFEGEWDSLPDCPIVRLCLGLAVLQSWMGFVRFDQRQSSYRGQCYLYFCTALGVDPHLFLCTSFFTLWEKSRCKELSMEEGFVRTRLLGGLAMGDNIVCWALCLKLPGVGITH